MSIAAALTLPGWTLAILGGLGLLAQISPLVNPTERARKRGHDNHTARLLAFTLAVINLYDIKGALEDDWIVYKFSLLSRLVAAALLYSFGPVWRATAVAEFVTFVVLGAAMLGA